MNISFKEYKELVFELLDKMKTAGVDKIELEFDDTKIKLAKNAPVAANYAAAPAPVVLSEAASVSAPVAELAEKPDFKAVKSPLVGVAYAAPSPDAEPFVKVGDTVKKGDVICIVEAMKVMNEIESDLDGTVEAILFKNGEAVEYGAPLIKLR